MGYFASRAAPFGAASPELVTATFFNFRPSMVARALPDAWSLASPDDVLTARSEGSVAALRRLLSTTAVGDTAGSDGDDGAALFAPDGWVEDLAEAVDLAEAAVSACSLGGRPIFGALRALPVPADPLGRLWHAATLLREHRGDGHVAANLAHGLDGLAAHVTFAVAHGPVQRSTLQPHRGWTDQEWDEAERTLAAKGLLRSDGSLSDEGRAVRGAVERVTDELAGEPWRVLGPATTGRLHALVAPLARAIIAAEGIPAVNPMGVPTDALAGG